MIWTFFEGEVVNRDWLCCVRTRSIYSCRVLWKGQERSCSQRLNENGRERFVGDPSFWEERQRRGLQQQVAQNPGLSEGLWGRKKRRGAGEGAPTWNDATRSSCSPHSCSRICKGRFPARGGEGRASNICHIPGFSACHKLLFMGTHQGSLPSVWWPGRDDGKWQNWTKKIPSKHVIWLKCK